MGPKRRIGLAARDVAFFGRDTEIALIRGIHRTCPSRFRRFVIPRWTTRLGRSTLLCIGPAQHSASAEMSVLTAIGHESERTLPFGGALQLFEQELERAEPAERARLLSGAAALASPLLARARTTSFPDDPSVVVHGLYLLCLSPGPDPAAAPLYRRRGGDRRRHDQLLIYLSHRLDDLPAVILMSANTNMMAPAVAASSAIRVRCTCASARCRRKPAHAGCARRISRGRGRVCAACHEAREETGIPCGFGPRSKPRASPRRPSRHHGCRTWPRAP